MTKDNVVPFTKNRLLKLSLHTIMDELFGTEITKEWLETTDLASLEPIAEGEEAFDFELEDWEKKLFQITAILQAHIEAILKGRGEPELIKEEGLLGPTQKKVFSYSHLANSFRELLWSILPLRHPELMGPFAYGVRKDYKIVKVPLKNLIKPNIITDPNQVAELLKGLKPPGGMN